MDGTGDGGFIVSGTCRALDMTIPATKTVSGEAITLSNRAGITTTNGLIIKYNADRLIEWAAMVSGSGSNALNQVYSCINSNGEEEYLVTCELSNAIFSEEDIIDGLDIGYETGNWKGTLKYNSEGKICKSFYGIESFEYNPKVYINEDNSRIVMQKNVAYEYDQDDNLINSFSMGNLPFTFNCIDKTDNGYIASGLYAGNYTISASLTESNESISLLYNGQNDAVFVEFNDEFLVISAFMYGSQGNDSNARIKVFENGEINIVMNFAGQEILGDSIVLGPTIIRLDEDKNIIVTDSEMTETSNFTKARKTADGGIIAVGNYSGSITLDVNGEEKTYYSNGGTDGIIIKYYENNLIEWAYTIGSGGDDTFKSVIENDGKYIAVGEYKYAITVNADDTLLNENIELGLKTSNYSKGMLFEFNEDGKITDYLNLSNTSAYSFYGIENSIDSGYILNVAYCHTLNVPNVEGGTTSVTVSYNGYNDAALFKLDENYNLITYATFGSGVAKNETFNFMQMSNDGGVVVSGKLGVTMTVTTKYGEDVELVYGWEDPFIIKYNSDLEMEWASAPGGSYGGSKYSLATSDNGAILVGTMYYGGISIPAEKTVDGEAISFTKYGQAWCGFIVKYNEEGLAEWGYRFPSSYSNLGDIRAVEGTDEIILIINDGVKFEAENTFSGKVISTAEKSGYKTIARIKLDGKVESADLVYNIPLNGVAVDNNTYLLFGSTTTYNRSSGLIVELDDNIIEAEVASQQLIEVANYKKELEITTEVKVHDDGTIGGTISGEGDTPYETVIYGDNATKEIIITPDEDYKILSIKVNDVEQEYTILDDGTVKITFENVTENKHVLVEFSNTVSEVLVHHYIDGTEDKVFDDESIVGNIGESYTTSPKMDLEEYELVLDKLPANASGVFTEDVQEVIYYYQEKKVTLTVYHYLEGTTEELSESVSSEYSKDEEYTTEEANDIEEKYELVEVPVNSTGTITENTVVYYYYRVKTYNITTQVQGTGGDITGSGEISVEEVEHGSDSTTEIVITPEEGYYVENIEINGENIDFISGTDRVVILDTFAGMTENKDIIVTFARIEGQVIVHHYIVDTTESVPSNVEGEVVSDEIKVGYVGDTFATMESSDIATYYELVSKSEETSGTYTEEVQEIYYYYGLKDYNYTVEYYYDGIIDSTKTDILVATWGDVISSYTDKNITGYTLEKTEGLDLTIIENEDSNLIKVYYVKDKFNYTVEYYYNDVIDDSKTEVIEATYQDIISTYTDKVELGYKLDKVDSVPLTITELEENNVIKVYYVTDESQTKTLSYTVEYYKNNELVTADTDKVSITVQYLEPDTMKVSKVNINITDKYFGYKLDDENTNIPDEVTSGDIIKVYYVIDESQTKELSYTVEYYKDGNIVDSDTESFTKTVQVLENDILEVDVSLINITNKYVGYKFEKTEPDTIPTEIESGSVIKVYYVKDTFKYTVEYYFENVIDSTLTEEYTALYGDIIDTYVDKVKVGYKLDKVDLVPLTITELEENNVIKIYYVIDESQTKTLNYTVEYYKNNVLVSTDTQVESETVQILEPDTLEVNKSKINLTDKYYGYKLDADNTNVPDEVNNGETVKIYYITDESVTKKLFYTVEYYKDNELDETKVFTETVQVLEDDNLDVDISSINVTDKYVGYKFVKTEPSTIPNIINSGEVIKVYYEKDNFEYSIEYYYDGIIDDSKTETGTAIFESTINTYTDKVIDGYKLDKVDKIPLTITENESENIIRIYYVIDESQTKELSYIVEYYKDGVIVDSDTEVFTETVQVLEDDTLEVDVSLINVTNKYVGYKFEKTEPNSVPSEVETEAVIKVYYVKDSFKYTVEYYYNDVLDSSLTEEYTALYGDTIDTYVDKVKDGYIQGGVSGLPLVVSEDALRNVIRVFYVTDPTQTKELSYTVEYYKDGNIVDSDTASFTKTVQLLEDDILEVDSSKINVNDKYVGYKFEKTEPNTIPTEVESGSVIKVYYVKDTFDYIVEYYYENVIDPTKSEVSEATYQDVIDTYEDKVITGYEFDKVEGLPLTITENESTNVIKVYYVKAKFNYTVEYYYDDVIDSEKTDTFEGVYGSRVESYTAKEEYGYKFDKVDIIPFTITEDEAKNVIKVYYVRKDSDIKVQYVDKINGGTISEDVVKEGKVLDTFDISGDVKEIPGYTLIESPENMTGRFEEEEQVFTYYYAITSSVVVKHLENDTNVELLPTETIEGYESKEYSTSKKDVLNYTFVKDTGNTSGTMKSSVITVIYYYAQNTKVTVNHIDKNTSEVLAQDVQNGKVGDEYTSKAKNIENYVLVEEPVSKTVTMTKDEIILNYYYAHISSGVIEKHIDIKTGELLGNQEFEGNEGDYYKTQSKEFKGYDLVEDKLPENAEGTMTIDAIEVIYYYIRKTAVNVKYIDTITGKEIPEIVEGVEESSFEYIEGHEGDSYITELKTFNGYDVYKLPDNANGIMNVITNSDGEVSVITDVVYEYIYRSNVIINHIDVMTGDIIESEVINGHEGDNYEVTAKDYDNYDVIEEKLPNNETGTMTKDDITINYYYIYKSKVTVNYIDLYTKGLLKEVDKTTKAEIDSTIVINGHEGDSYETITKTFDGYELRTDMLPDNKAGVMEKGDITVNYYYSYKTNVKVLYIEKATGKNVAESTLIQGYEGDDFKVSAKEVEGYKLLETPKAESGKMTKDQITLVYYYIKLSGGVKINYIDISDNSKLGEDTLTGYVGDEYEVTQKSFDGYDLILEKLPTNTKGQMKDDVIEVNYYYSKKVTVGTSVETTPTGDRIMNTLLITAYTVLGVNVVSLLKKKRRLKNK